MRRRVKGEKRNKKFGAVPSSNIGLLFENNDEPSTTPFVLRYVRNIAEADELIRQRSCVGSRCVRVVF
jgi:hypothetical protein